MTGVIGYVSAIGLAWATGLTRAGGVIGSRRTGATAVVELLSASYWPQMALVVESTTGTEGLAS